MKRGFFVSISDDSEPQNSVAGTLTFYGAEPYRQWQEFVDWCSANAPLQLVYSPLPGQEFFRQIDIAYLSKSEKNEVGALDVPVSFLSRSPWFRPEPSQLSFENVQGSAIRYTYRYTDDLVYGTDSSATLSGNIFPGGHVPAGLLLRYTGAILNPRIRLVGNVSGKTYGICAVTAEFEQGDTFELSTIATDSHVYKIAADGKISDLEDSLNLAAEPYFEIPTDETSLLSIEADAAFDGSAQLEVHYYFRSV